MSELQIIKGSTYRDVVRWGSSECVFLPATIVPGAPVRLNVASHNIPDDWCLVYIENSPNFNERTAQTVKVIDADTLEIPCLNGTKFKGGACLLRVLTPVELTGYQARMQIRDRVGGTILAELSSLAQVGEPRIIIDDIGKSITREIPASVTEAFEFKRGVFDLEMMIGDEVIKIDSGTVSTQEEVTK